MDTKALFKIIGNGDAGIGLQRITDIAQRLQHARAKHPHFADDMQHASFVVFDEAEELVFAVHEETEERAHDEALDVIATAIRFKNKEYESD